jgi:hypothetical protein
MDDVFEYSFSEASMDKPNIDKFFDSLSDVELKEKWNKYERYSEQETVEEAADKYKEFWLENKGILVNDIFEAGAKWQAERIVWSEEAVIELLHSRMRYTLGVDYKEITTLEWFSQFKK